ncbi:hypothetical protein [Pedobacter sp. SYP-B3415]|uniref:hypothetical protein n=1 Tax=Pedobacter sp. SYP-B3415 TaxID=2496641 RepID=UPI00101D35E0|nr:hypothetical protein [Pedobacter sp. SYP-B3415]
MFVFLLFLFSPIDATAQMSAGGRAAGMGASIAAFHDPWSVNGNPAGTAGQERLYFGVTHTRHFLTADLHTSCIVAVVPIGRQVFGAALERYSFDSYALTSARVSYSRRFGRKISAGVSFSYAEQRIVNYGSTNVPSTSAGIQFAILPELIAGVTIRDLNMNNPKIRPPVFCGLGWRASDKLLLQGELFRDPATGLGFITGIEYLLISVFALRTGIQSKPFSQFAGLGFYQNNLRFDLACSHHPVLGLSPQLSLGYAF